MPPQVTPQVTPQVIPQVTPQVDYEGEDALLFEKILDFCSIPRALKDILEYLGYRDRKNFNRRYLKPLLDSGRLCRTKERNNSKTQKYIAADALCLTERRLMGTEEH